MAIEALLEMLLDHGSLGIFAAFLIWLYTNMQARMDALVDRFQAQLEEMQNIHKGDQELLRERYDDVIAKYDSEKKQMRLQIKQKVEAVGSIVQKIDQKTSSFLVKQDSDGDDIDFIKTQVNQINEQVKNIGELVKSMDQENRVRNLVAMAQGDTLPPK
tara:strand:+ start:726 stop:1202 length:477 start_codon:yes stop_codon:yes gene_type:complete